MQGPSHQMVGETYVRLNLKVDGSQRK